MSGMLLLFLLLFFVLAVGLFAGTLFIQATLYSEPTPQLYWKAPAASAVLTGFFFIWTYLDYRNPGRFNTLFEFSAREDTEFKKLWSVKKGQRTLYEAQKSAGGRVEFRDPRTNRTWSRSDTDGIVEMLIVEDADKNEASFAPELTVDGKFVAKQGEPVRYLEVGGKRVMTDEYLGRIAVTRWGVIFLNLLLNFLHVVVWFLALWLLLRFQWPHALGFACVFWLIMTFLMPTLFNRAEELGRSAAAARKAAL